MVAREGISSGRSRITALRALVLLAAVGELHVRSPAAEAAAWRQPAFSASRSSFNPRETEIDAGNVATLVERWRVPGAGAFSAPVAAGGRVFVSNGAEMLALSLAGGAELWRTAAQDEYSFGSPVLTPDGKVTAEHWFVFGSGIALFDRADGTFSGGPGGGFHGSRFDHAIRGNEVFTLNLTYGSGGPFFVYLQPYAGIVDFSGLPPPSWGGLAVRGDRAYVAVGTTLEAFDLLSCPDPVEFGGVGIYCMPVWTAAIPGAFEQAVAFRSSVVVASDDGTLQVRAAASGDVEWSAMLGAGVAHAPAVARRRIFVPTKRGLIVAFDSRGCGTATCAPVGRFHLGSPATGQPVVAGDVLYAGTKDGRIVAFATSGCMAAACDPLLDVDLGGGAIVAGPIVVDGTVIAGTADGQLVALGRPH